MIVTDVNGVVFLLLDNPTFSPDARAAYDRDDEWAAPPLWRSELCNTLMQYVRSDDESIPGTDLTLEGAIERVSAAEAFIGNRTFEVDAEAVLRLADRSGCSPYDCEYVQLAAERDARLLTYDEPVLEAFPEIAVRPGDFAADT
ncbi:MAG: VapC toxin family PIN domain ribonuclease [Bacteroidetes bacterium QS_8_68_15]|nr:MAG: VapC toxin family PIN domain ribonuclease [Bacteroidetes bacterium QS_8_68_15]